MATTFKLPRMRIERPSAQDRRRWCLWKLDKPVEEIAARDHAAIRDVQASIDRVESYKLLPGSELLLADMSAVSMEMLGEWKDTVHEARGAMTVRTMANGREKLISDHPTRLAAAREIREMASLTQPKGPAIVNNLLQQNNPMGQRSGSGMDFESRLRMLRAKNEAQLPTIIQAQLPAPEEKTAMEILADDMEGAGIELDANELAELDELEEDEDGDETEDDEADSDEAEEESAIKEGKVIKPARGPRVDEDWL